MHSHQARGAALTCAQARITTAKGKKHLKIDLFDWLHYYDGVQDTSCGFSRLFLAFALGAGVWGFTRPALAGDKIEFSSASETLALPAVERADDTSVQIFHLGNASLSPDLTPGYPVGPTPEASPPRRHDDRGSRSGLFSSTTGGHGPDNGDFEHPDWAADATATSYNSTSNRSDELSPWLPSANSSGLARANGDSNARPGQSEEHSDSFNSLTRQDHQDALGYRSAGERDWAYRAGDAYALNGKPSVAEQLKPEKASPLPSRTGLGELFSQTAPQGSSGFSVAPSISSSMAPSMLPSSPMGARPDTAGPGYNGISPFTGRNASLSSGKTTGNSDSGFAGGVPAMRTWGGLSGFGPQASAPTPPHKPISQAAPGPGQPQHGGAFLPWINKPGGIPGAPVNNR